MWNEGWEPEALTGHVTHLGLLRRENLSLFHYGRFALRFYYQREPLWTSAHYWDHDLDRSRLGQTVAARRSRQRCFRLWLRSGTLFLECFRRCCGEWGFLDVRWRCGAVLVVTLLRFSCLVQREKFSVTVLVVRFHQELAETIPPERWETDSIFREVSSRLLSSHL